MFRAYEPEQGRLVAVKLFRLDLPPDRVHRLVGELDALIAADVAHPGIAAPVAAGVAGVSAYLAQDFVTADSLDTVVRAGAASVADVARVISQLGGALATAAALGVTHGALHPRDVLMSSDDARITGVGVAQALERAGTVAPVRRPYSAPERVSGGPWDRRADVFSLAALAYEMLTGRRIPGPGDLTPDLLGDVPGVDRQAVRRVLSRALAEHPGDRFDTTIAFGDALREALGKRSKAATGRFAARPLPLDADEAMTEPAPSPFAPLPVEELPLLTDEMLASPESEEPEQTALVDPADDELPLVAAALPDDDLPLAPGDAQPALADLHLADAVEPEFILARQDLASGLEADVRAADADDTTRPIFAMPRERPTAIVVPRTRTDEAVPVPAVAPEPETSRTASGVLPLVLALVVGMAIGVPVGVFVAPERPAPRDVNSLSSPPVVIAEEPIREFTDRAVAREPTPVTQAPVAPVAAANATAPLPAPGQPVRQPMTEPMPVSTPPSADRPSVAAATRAERRAAPAERVAAAKPVPARASAARPGATSAAAPTRPRSEARAATTTPAATPAPAPKNEPGSLAVDSRPPGASVFLDGKLVGTTPLVMSSVALGEHAIHLERAGYQRWASSVRIAAGERRRVAASLEFR